MVRPLADGSRGDRRAETACVRICDALMGLSKKADRLAYEMDEATLPGTGIVNQHLDDDDSLISAIQDLRPGRGTSKP